MLVLLVLYSLLRDQQMRTSAAFGRLFTTIGHSVDIQSSVMYCIRALKHNSTTTLQHYNTAEIVVIEKHCIDLTNK